MTPLRVPDHDTSHFHMSCKPLGKAFPRYDAVDFGHPHETAEEQVTEPFHWQYPNWAKPGYHLYYYQHYGYFDHPLYTTKTPDGRRLVTSYGNGQRFHKSPMVAPSEIPSKRPKHEMVDVYNVDEFVGEVSLRLLTRFSDVASVTFLDSEKTRTVKLGSEQRGVGQTERSTSRHSTTIQDLILDKAFQKLEKTISDASGDSSPTASPKSTASKPCSGRTRSDTRTTGLTIPDEFEVTSHQKYQRPHRPRRGVERNGKKELRLDLNVSEMPTKTAIREAIAWMKSNEKLHGDQTLPFGPDDLVNLSLEDVVDLYQAALAFGMQPWPGRLRLELNERLTSTRLDYHTFRNITRRLPLADSCVSRAINEVEYHTFRRHYTDAEIDVFKTFESRPGNEALRARIHELGVVRQHARQARRNRDREQKNLQVVQRPAQVIAGHIAGGEDLGEDKRKESTHCQPQAAMDPPDQTPRHHRRRARRGQQPEGMAHNGADIPGANYE